MESFFFGTDSPPFSYSHNHESSVEEEEEEEEEEGKGQQGKGIGGRQWRWSRRVAKSKIKHKDKNLSKNFINQSKRDSVDLTAERRTHNRKVIGSNPVSSS